ncbi:XisI protein [Chloroflexi bacterium TSY]|nr:XisI protein [Chloroflexi bacterium TSY]
MATVATPVNEYRIHVQELLKQYANQTASSTDIETQLIFDSEGDHYQLVTMGWQNHRRIYGCILHIDIKDDKVWIQHNGTERLVAEELVESGIPKEHIVLGFHSPFTRQFTDFAVN